MALNPVHKGKRGENEFCRWCDENLDYEDTDRNYNQAKGGADVITNDFIFEVKRRQSLDLDSWWYQCVIAKKRHKDKNLIPIVAFRKNRDVWQFLIPAYFISGLEKGYLIASERIFIKLARTIIRDKSRKDRENWKSKWKRKLKKKYKHK